MQKEVAYLILDGPSCIELDERRGDTSFFLWQLNQAIVGQVDCVRDWGVWVEFRFTPITGQTTFHAWYRAAIHYGSMRGWQ